jgi:hypothetical protein
MSSDTTGNNLNTGGDWDGSYAKDSTTKDVRNNTPAPNSSTKKTSAYTKLKATVTSKDTMEIMEKVPPVEFLDSPIVKVSPFIAGGLALLLGAKAGYGRQLDKYELEEIKWGEKKDKWGRKVMAPRPVMDVPKNWSPHNVAMKALGIGTMVALGSFALGTAATFWYYEVDTPQEFSEKMRVVIPPKFKAMQEVVRPPLEGLKDGLGYMFGTKKKDNNSKNVNNQ